MTQVDRAFGISTDCVAKIRPSDIECYRVSIVVSDPEEARWVVETLEALKHPAIVPVVEIKVLGYVMPELVE